MKHKIILTLVLLLNLYKVAFTQNTEILVNSVEEAIETHVKKLRNFINDENAILYYIVDVALHEGINLSNNDVQIVNCINSKHINKSKKNFLIKFSVLFEKKSTKITANYSTITKRKKRRLMLTWSQHNTIYEIKGR